MPKPNAGYSPWEATDEADEAVTGPLDAAPQERVEGMVLELLSISENRAAAKEARRGPSDEEDR